MTTVAERAYLAGILDGEGSISMTRVGGAKRDGGYWRIVITVSSCDEELIDWLHHRWNGSVMKNMDRGPTKRAQHRWVVVGKAARVVLADSLRFLVIKEQRARWAIEVLTIQGRKRRPFEIYPDGARERLAELRALFDNDSKRSWSVKGRPHYV